MEPRSVKYPLGSVSHIYAETFGEPGSRTFRLVMESGPARSYVWLEKEQLFQLGIYLQQAMRSLSEEDRARASQAGEPAGDTGETPVEFKARQMQLSYDVPANSFYLVAYEDEESEEELASISCWIAPNQAERLFEDALRICAAGRPPCFLCGLPIDSKATFVRGPTAMLCWKAADPAG